MSKKIIIVDNRFIRQMGIYGPISRPTVYEDSFVKKLVADGHAVYECLADGGSKRLSLDDFAPKPAPVRPEHKPAPKPVEVKVEKVVEEPAPIENGEAFNGVSETTAPTMPAKEEPEEAPVATTTKAQRKANKKAKLEAKKAEEAAAAAEATEEKTEE